eukprot:SAG11_NODE_1437_length_4909_cov_2.303742_3_plen_280_part_00
MPDVERKGSAGEPKALAEQGRLSSLLHCAWVQTLPLHAVLSTASIHCNSHSVGEKLKEPITPKRKDPAHKDEVEGAAERLEQHVAVSQIDGFRNECKVTWVPNIDLSKSNDAFKLQLQFHRASKRALKPSCGTRHFVARATNAGTISMPTNSAGPETGGVQNQVTYLPPPLAKRSESRVGRAATAAHASQYPDRETQRGHQCHSQGRGRCCHAVHLQPRSRQGLQSARAASWRCASCRFGPTERSIHEIYKYAILDSTPGDDFCAASGSYCTDRCELSP